MFASIQIRSLRAKRPLPGGLGRARRRAGWVVTAPEARHPRAGVQICHQGKACAARVAVRRSSAFVAPLAARTAIPYMTVVT